MHTLSEPEAQHQPGNPSPEGRSTRGRLNLSKCSFCRKDKKGCKPQARQWPQKCDRCSLMGLQCSPNTRARRQKKAARRNPLPLVADDSSTQASSPATTRELPSSSDSQEVQHFNNWTHADFSNAVSFLKIARRMIRKSKRWEKHRKDYRGLDVPIGKTQVLVNLMETLQDGLLKYISSQITGIMQERNETVASETSRLHLLACSILETPQAEYASETYDMTIHVHDGAIVKSMIKTMAVNEEVGAALLLEEQCLVKEMERSSDDQMAAFIAFNNRFKMFHPVLGKLRVYFQAAMDCFEEEAEDVISRFSSASVIDSNAPWVHMLVQHNALWGLTDCLGSPILHGILAELGRKSFSLTEEEKEYFYANIGPYCAEHELRDTLHRSALHIATEYDLPALVRAILESGVSPEVEDCYQQCPLHYAALLGHMGICNTLLSFNAKADSENNIGFTPLDCAFWDGNEDVVSLLLGSGAGDAIEDRWKGAVFTRALMDGSPRLCVLALDWYERSFAPETLEALQDDCGYTFFHMAVVSGHLEVLKDLVKRSVKGSWWRLVNLQDRYGRTALCETVCRDRGEEWEAMIEILLSIDGLDIEIPDIHGKTAVDYAKSCGNSGILVMLNEKRRLNSMRGEGNIGERGLSTTLTVQEVPSLSIPPGFGQLAQLPQLLPPPDPTSMSTPYSYMHPH
ncbi:putative ankyrin repeat protein [Triangularia verruculosa]|uniref:Ankyrin repeat protein n=1 Tax=Triangularia verruculosa TaxID=2587418 RepID=A0AAN7ATX1_9PEZI|nr:putative ankyrin repeat protein [Triangularia verruculosa]